VPTWAGTSTRMKISLFALDVSNFCSPIKIALNFKGVPYEEMKPPGGYGSTEFKSFVPMGTIPAIQVHDDDGKHLVTISESSVILEYVEDKFPIPSLMLEDPAGKAAVRFVNRSCFSG
jgi:glutathione S-transferase